MVKKPNENQDTPGVLAETSKRGTLLGEISFNIPAIFNGKTTFNEDVKINNKNLSLGTGSISASNIIYSLRPGANISITGDKQNPTISASISGNFVTSLQGQSGAVAFVEGEGITIDGLTIINSDPGSAQNIFKTVSVEGSSITAGSNDDTLELAAGDGISLSTDGNKVTITNSAPSSGSSGSTSVAVTQDGTTVVTALTTLDFAGSDFTVTQSPTGEANITTILGSSINLASSEVTGVLPIANGGTGATTLANLIALGTDTTGNYIATLTGGSGLTVSGSGSETAAASVALGPLTSNWDQTGAFDIVLNNASSELQILESTGGTFFGTIDVGNLSANRTYTFPDGAGTVCILELGNCGGGGGGNISGSGTAGQITFFNGANTITSETTGFSWDATNKRLGLGTDTPGGKLDIQGTSTGQALAIFNETGDQNILTASASGTTRLVLDRTGNLNIVGGAYQIGGTNVLTSNSLGTGILSSSLTSVGVLNGGSITSGFGTIDTGDTITGTTINGTTGLSTNGVQRVDSSGNLLSIGTIDSTYLDASSNTVNLAASTSLQFDGTTVITATRNLSNLAGVATSLNPTAANTYNLGTGVGNQYNTIYGNTLYQNGNQVCDTSGNCSSLTVTYWNQTNGALTPKNSTVDLLVGGTSTASAKFAVLNMTGSGTPTASVSGSNGAAYLTANGTIATTNNQSLTLGATGTGNIILNGFGTGIIKSNASGVLSSSAVNLASSDVTGTLPITNGGTGVTGTPTNGQLLIGNGSGYTLATLTGTSNQINVTNGSGSITLSTPQNIHTGATPTFASLLLSANTNQLTLGSGTTGTITMAALGSNRTYTLPDASGTICLDSGNCPSAANYWQLNSNALAPGGSASVTDKLVLGGNTTTSHQFEVNGKQTGKALVSLNETGNQDIFTASSSGTTRFIIGNDGTLTATKYTTNNGLLYTNASGVVAQSNAGTSGQILLSNSGTPTFTTLSGDIASITAGGAVTLANVGTAGTYGSASQVPVFTTDAQGRVSSVTNTAIAIAASQITSGQLSSARGGTGADLSAATQYSLPYFSATGVMSSLAPSTAGYVLTTNGAGAAPSWADPASLGTNYWNQTNGALSPKISTLDLLIGGVATNAAKFAVTNMTGSGTPTASVSAGLGGTGGTYITAGGTLATTDMQSLRLGSSSTGNIILNGFGAGIVKSNASGVLSSSAVNLASSDVTGTLGIANGGTGVTGTPTNGQLLIGNGSGYTLAGLTGTANQINVTNGSGSITLSTPQNIHTAATPTFASLTLTANTNQLTFGTGNTGTFTMASLTGNQTYTLPNESGNVCLSSGNCAGGAGGSKWQRNSNVLAPLTATDLVVLGGNTATAFQFEVNGKQTGKALVSLNETGDQNILTASASGTTVFSLNRNGNLEFTGNSGFLNTFTSAATQARTYTLPNGTGTICLVELGNCAGSGGGITGSGTAGQIAYFNGAGTITSETSGFAWDATNNKLGIGNDTPVGKLDINGAVTGKALAILNETGNQDIFTASASGTTRFVIANDGTVTASKYTTNNGLLYTNGSGVITQAAAGTSGQVMLSNSGTPTFTTLSGDIASITAGGAVTLANVGTAGTYGSASQVPVITTDAQGRVSSVTNTAIAIAASQITSGQLSSARGGTGADLSAATQYSLPYFSATGVMSSLAPSTAGYVLTTNGAGSAPSWTDPSALGTNYWNQTNGALSPKNSTLDLLIGGVSSASAKFAVLNMVGSGTPTASVSGSNGAAYLTANGTIATTNNQSLTLGATGTGNIILNGFGAGIIKSNASGVLSSSAVNLASSDVTGTLGIANGGTGVTATPTNGQLLIGNGTGYSLATITAGSGINISNGSGTITISQAGAGTSKWTENQTTGILTPNQSTLDVLFGGTATDSAKFGILNMAGGIPTASLSAGTNSGLALNASGNIQTYAGQTLSLGGSQTGNIVLDSGNGVIRLADLTTNGIVYTSGNNGTLNSEAQLATSRGGLGANVTAAGAGEILYSTSATTYDSLAAGLAGQALVSGGAGSPTWTTGTLTLAGNFATAGTSSLTLTTTGATNVTLPTTGTLATLAGSEALTNKTVNGLSLTANADGFSIAGGTSSRTLNVTNSDITLSGGGNTLTLTGNASLNQNLLTSSSPSFTGLTVSGLNTNNNSVLYTNGSGTVLAATTTGSGECLRSNGSGTAPTWSTCPGASATNYWQLNNGAVSPFSETLDLLVGSTATTSAEFSVLGIAAGTNPTASVSATSGGNGGNGIVLAGDGSIQSLRNNTLTLGGNTTGNISLTENTFLSGNFTQTGTGTFTTGTGQVTLAGNVDATNGLDVTGANLTVGGSNFSVSQATGTITTAGDLEVNGGDITSTGTLTLTPTTTLTLNSTGDMTLDSSADIILDADGGDVRLRDAGVAFVTLTNTSTDLTLDVAGGNFLLSNGDTLNAGGAAGTAYNFFAGDTSGNTLASSDNDLYIEDRLEVDGEIRFDAATITLGNAAFTNCGTLGTSSGALTCGSSVNANYWQLNNGTISPFSNTLDVLFGGTASTSAVMKISPSGTSPTASISANTSSAGLLVDNRGSGDLFAASSSGMKRFSIAQNGSLNVWNRNRMNFYQDNGATLQGYVGHESSSGDLALISKNANSWLRLGSSGLGGIGFWTDGNADVNTSPQMFLNSSGQLSLGTISSQATLDVRAASGTQPIASFSGQTAMAGMVVDNRGVGDIFTASSSGLNRFVIKQNGNVGIGTTNPTALLDVAGTINASGLISANAGLTVANGQNLTLSGLTTNNNSVLYTNGSGTVLAATTTGSSQCLLSNGAGAAPSWGTCPGAASGQNYWQVNSGALSPFTGTTDLLVGSTATASAKFSVLGIAAGTNPTASVSATTGANSGNGIVIAGDGSIQSLMNNTLTLGGSTTGNISLTENTLLSGNFTQTGTGTFATGTGQVTLAGNVDATNGLDVTGANLTVGGANFSVAQATGDIATAGDLTVSGGDIVSAATANLLNTTSTTVNFAGAATTLNIADAAITGTIDIGGVTNNGATTVNIATNGTSADTIAIGNTNASTLLSLTGGDDWSLASTGIFTLSASAAQTTAIDVTDTSYTNAISIGDNNILGTTANIDFSNFDVVGSTGNITTAGDLAVNGDDITSDGNLTINATGYVRIGDTATPTVATGDDDLFVEGDLEVDGVIQFDSATITLGNAAFTTCGTLGTSAGALTCSAAGGTNWDVANGAISPKLASTLDFLLGGNSSASAKFKVSPSGTSPTASISANTSSAGLLVDNKGNGDLFTASNSGFTRFRITNNGALTSIAEGTNSLAAINQFDTTVTKTGTGLAFGNMFRTYAAQTGASTGNTTFSTYSNLEYDSTSSTTQNGDLVGALNQVNFRGTGNSNGGGRLIGSIGKIVNYSGSGTADDALGFLADATYNGGSVTNSYGFYAANPTGSATVTNAYGLYVADITKGSTNNYALYAAGGKTFFADEVGIGVTPTSASLEITQLNTTGEGFHLNAINGGLLDAYAFLIKDSGNNVAVGYHDESKETLIRGNHAFWDSPALKVQGLEDSADIIRAENRDGSKRYFTINGSGTDSTASVSGETSYAALVADNRGTGDIFTASSAGQTRFTIKQNGVVQIGTNTNGITFDYLNGGPNYYGGARPTKRLVLSPEYPGAVLTASGSASGTNGLMTSDASTSAVTNSNFQTYYQWTSSQTSSQNYTIALRVKLPADFAGWSPDGMTIDFNTALTTNDSNKMDVFIYNRDDSLTAAQKATPVVFDQNLVSTTAKTWRQRNYTPNMLSSWSTASQSAVIMLKMTAKNNNYVQVGDIVLNYLSKF